MSGERNSAAFGAPPPYDAWQPPATCCGSLRIDSVSSQLLEAARRWRPESVAHGGPRVGRSALVRAWRGGWACWANRWLGSRRDQHRDRQRRAVCQHQPGRRLRAGRRTPTASTTKLRAGAGALEKARRVVAVGGARFEGGRVFPIPALSERCASSWCGARCVVDGGLAEAARAVGDGRRVRCAAVRLIASEAVASTADFDRVGVRLAQRRRGARDNAGTRAVLLGARPFHRHSAALAVVSAHTRRAPFVGIANSAGAGLGRRAQRFRAAGAVAKSSKRPTRSAAASLVSSSR